MLVLLVFAGGCLGAATRYATDHLVHHRVSRRFPWGTLTVNVVGSVVLGIIAGAASPSSTYLVAFVATGFCGALTTFSTFGYETVRLASNRMLARATLNVVVSLAGGLAGVAFGYVVGAALAGH